MMEEQKTLFRKSRVVGWSLLILLIHASATAVPVAAPENCASELHQHLLNSGWENLSAPEILDSSGLEDVLVLQTLSIKRTLPTVVGGNTYPRYRIDIITFPAPEDVPLFKPGGVQHHPQTGPGTAFPARRFCRHGSGMNFSPVTWDYSYVLYVSARINDLVVIVYTDVVAFEEYLPGLSATVFQFVGQACGEHQ